MKGLNLVLSIFTRLSFSRVVESRVGVADGKLFYVACGVKFLCVVDVGSWCLFHQHSKSMLHCHTK